MVKAAGGQREWRSAAPAAWSKPGATAVSGLLDRDEELERIAAAFAAAMGGSGGLLAVVGGAGIGKTRLMEASMELCTGSGGAVLSARGGQGETEFAFGVVRQLFEPVWAACGRRERDALLAGAAAPAASLLGKPAVASEIVSGGDRSFATLHGLYWLTVNLAARGPLVMVVDDAHWVDAPSLRFLVYLARRVQALPVLLVVALRGEDPGARGLLVRELVSGPRAEVLRPGSLTLEAVGTLVRDAFSGRDVDREFLRVCWATTGGNPLLLWQLIGALRARGSRPTVEAVEQLGEVDLAAVSRWVHLRLASLPPSAAALAGAAAVLGDGVDPRQVALLAGLDDASRDEALDGLVSAGILHEADGLAFVHPLVRSAVYAEPPPRRRARAHREAARLLVGGAMVWERVAPHLLAAVPAGDEEVVDMLLDAARAAVRAGAPDLAVRYLKRAMVEPPPAARQAELLRELGEAEQAGGQFNAAAEHLREALACTEELGSRIQIAFALRYALVWSDRAHEVASALDDLVTEAAEHDPEGALLLETAVAGAMCIVDLSTHGAEHARLRRLTDPASCSEATAPNVASLAAVDALFSNQPVARVNSLAEQAIRGWPALPRFARGPMRVQLYVALTFSEHFSLAQQLLDEQIDDARQNGSTAQFLNAAPWRSMLFWRLGALADAEADARGALEAVYLGSPRASSSSLGPSDSLYAPMALAVLLQVMIERGQLEEAERALNESGFATHESASLLFSQLIGARGRLRAAQGRTRQAIDELLALGYRYEGTIVNPAIYPWRSQTAVMLAVVGEVEEAQRLAGEELKLARVFGAPRALGVALQAAALTAAGDGVGLLREAVAVLQDSPARLEHARALVELGAALRRAGQRSEARRLLELGMDGAQARGSSVLAQRAREELRAVGARPRRVALTGVDALTGAERRVADLAAEGLTNRQIARTLVVSLATVETHLRHVFQKLDIASREQLTGHLDVAREPIG